MGEKYLIDSNVIIDYIANRLPEKGSGFVETLFNTDFIISVIVQIEVLGFSEVPDKLNRIEEFVMTAKILHLDKEVTAKTISLRRSYKKVKLGDAIIAATSLVHNLTLITHNTSDFKDIPELKVIDPHTL